MKASAAPRWALGALLLLPPLLLAAVLVHRSRQGPDGAASPASGEGATVRWSNGKPKLSTRAWRDGAASLQERCGWAQDGEALGCALLRDGQPWDGVLVDFEEGTGADAPLKELRRYERGQRHGTWRTFQPGGVVGVELEYDHGRLVSRRVRDVNGELVPAAEPAARLPGAGLPPKSFPPKRP